MEEMNESGEKQRKWHSTNICSAVLCYISNTTFSQILEVLPDFHRLFGSRNSQTTGILHTLRHVYRSVWPTRETISLTLVPHSNVLRTIVKLAYWCKTFSATSTPFLLATGCIQCSEQAWTILKRVGRYLMSSVCIGWRGGAERHPNLIPKEIYPFC